MAKKVIVEHTSDLSGEVTDLNLTFAVEGKEFEIDLTPQERTEFLELMERYTAAGRRVSSKARGGRTGSQQRDYDPKAVRAWASANGIEVSERGRVSADIVAKFKAAGN